MAQKALVLMIGCFQLDLQPLFFLYVLGKARTPASDLLSLYVMFQKWCQHNVLESSSSQDKSLLFLGGLFHILHNDCNVKTSFGSF